MPCEAIAAALVASTIGMCRLGPHSYVDWSQNIRLRWLLPILTVQALAFAGCGVAAWGIAAAIGVDAFHEDKWLANGCLWGVAGYAILGLQINALDYDKVSSPWVPLRVVRTFAREMLDLLAAKEVESRVAAMQDPELEQVAMDYFFRYVDSRTDVAATAKETQLQQLRDSCTQLRDTARSAEGRGRLRAFVRSVKVRN
jgi:hypothetical protein